MATDDRESRARAAMGSMFGRRYEATDRSGASDGVVALSNTLTAEFDRLLHAGRSIRDPYIYSSLAQVDSSLPMETNIANIARNFNTIDNKIRIVDRNVRTTSTLLEYNKRLLDRTNRALSRAIAEGSRKKFSELETKMEEDRLKAYIDDRIKSSFGPGGTPRPAAGPAMAIPGFVNPAVAGAIGGAIGASALGALSKIGPAMAALGRNVFARSPAIMAGIGVGNLPLAVNNPDNNLFVDVARMLDSISMSNNPNHNGKKMEDLVRTWLRGVKDDLARKDREREDNRQAAKPAPKRDQELSTTPVVATTGPSVDRSHRYPRHRGRVDGFKPTWSEKFMREVIRRGAIPGQPIEQIAPGSGEGIDHFDPTWEQTFWRHYLAIKPKPSAQAATGPDGPGRLLEGPDGPGRLLSGPNRKLLIDAMSDTSTKRATSPSPEALEVALRLLMGSFGPASQDAVRMALDLLQGTRKMLSLPSGMKPVSSPSVGSESMDFFKPTWSEKFMRRVLFGRHTASLEETRSADDDRYHVASLGGDPRDLFDSKPRRRSYRERMDSITQAARATNLESYGKEFHAYSVKAKTFDLKAQDLKISAMNSVDIESMSKIRISAKQVLTLEAPLIELVGQLHYRDIAKPMSQTGDGSMPGQGEYGASGWSPYGGSYGGNAPGSQPNRKPPPGGWGGIGQVNGGMGGGGGATAPSNLGGGSRAAQAFRFFKSKGWTDAQAAGLVGNLMAESGQNLDHNARGDGGSAFGIAQWHPDRQAKFQSVFGKSIAESTFEEQLAFVDWELNHTEKSAGNRLRSTTDAGTAAAVVDQFYERSSGAHRGKRIEYAHGIAGQVDSIMAPTQALGATNPAGLAPIRMTNQKATRNDPITDDLTAKLQEAVYATYGPGYSVEVYSGGQEAKGEGGRRTGSTRHDHGKAADVYVIGPDGKRVRGDALGRLGQYWAAKGYGGVGLEMNGGGIHLDSHTDRAPSWNYGHETPEARRLVELGKQGILPEDLHEPPPPEPMEAAEKKPPRKPPTGDSLISESEAVKKRRALQQTTAEPKLPQSVKENKPGIPNTHDNQNMSAGGLARYASSVIV